MLLFLTTCLTWTLAFTYESDERWGYENLPSQGKCPEFKQLHRGDCMHSNIGTCGYQQFDWAKTSSDCWGGDLDVSTHACGCIINEDGKRYYNEPSGKSCDGGKEASMICKKIADVNPCEEVDGWTVTCNSSCRPFGPNDSDWFDKTYGDLDTSRFTTAECAALCTGDCVGFEVSLDGWSDEDGCGPNKFFTTVVISDLRDDTDRRSSCFQKTAPLEEDCADYDAEEGWVIECGHQCGHPINNYDITWMTGVSVTYCAELCDAGHCNYFNFNPQNGGSCQFFNDTFLDTGIWDSDLTWRSGACVHREIPEKEGCTDSEIFLELLACADPDSGELNSDGDFDIDFQKEHDMGKCELVQWMFSEGGCCEDCHQCSRESLENWYGITGCESDEDFFSKIKHGNFSSLTTVEILAVAAVAFILFSLIVGLCCCCKCSSESSKKTGRGSNMC